MFTGLVTDVATVERVAPRQGGARLTLRPAALPLAELALGESISCSGVCLTVSEVAGGAVSFDAVPETLSRTTVGSWRAGTRVNLERALALGDRLGGHIVQGHVDGVGTVLATEERDDAWLVDVALPTELAELMVPHGSITVDGVSLTVNALPAPGVVQLSIIEYTRRHTTLGDRAPGDPVHVEADVIGKYVQRLLAPYLAQRT